MLELTHTWQEQWVHQNDDKTNNKWFDIHASIYCPNSGNKKSSKALVLEPNNLNWRSSIGNHFCFSGYWSTSKAYNTKAATLLIFSLPHEGKKRSHFHFININTNIKCYLNWTVGRTIIPDLCHAKACAKPNVNDLSGHCTIGVMRVPHLFW